jgi:demethylmenaquinone methyltransferase/2-methoxy-6-polyprenyl-1,4-benzoquinol methylase
MALGDVSPFHRFARLYDLGMWGADRATLEAGFAAAERPVERVLDVGGGTGRASLALPDRETVVVDAARGMLREARGKGLATVQGDAATLPVRDGSADAVLVVDALHHMADPEGVFAAARRALSPGGVLVIREFDPTTLRGRGVVLGERVVGFDSQFWPPAELRDLLAAAGFEARVVEGGFGYTVAGVVEAADAPDDGDGASESDE